jgi:molybdenum cofactor biosynthesis enzyme
MKKKKLTHVTNKGKVRMVDVGGKEDTERYAVVRARILISRELLSRLRENTLESCYRDFVKTLSRKAMPSPPPA